MKKAHVKGIQDLIVANVTDLDNQNTAWDSNFYGKKKLWCTYSDSGNDHRIDSADNFEHDYITFAIYSTAIGPIQVTSDSLIAQLTADNLSISGYTVIECYQTLHRGPVKEDKAGGFRYWHMDLEFRIVTQKARS